MTVDPGFLKEIVNLVDGDTWQLADRFAERYPASEFGEGNSAARSGLHTELDEYRKALREQHGIKLEVSTMSTHRSTSLAWPPRARAQGAPYRAHQLLRTIDGRERLIDNLIKQNGGRLTANDVLRWRADNNPKPVETWDAKVERLLRQAIRRADPRSAQAREVVMEKLELLAREMRS